MQQVLLLLSARTKGKATNDEVEKAVNKILSTAGLGPPNTNNNNGNVPPTKLPAQAAPAPQIEVQVDTENYDYDVDDDKAKEEEDKKPSPPVVVKPTRGRKRKRPLVEEEEERKRQYEEIPLGAQGAKMLSAFGDGPWPIPETVSEALLGARKLLQVTIQDARALRRQTKQQFTKAQQEVAKGKRPKQQQNQNNAIAEAIVAPEMLFRAFIGYDRMARIAKCGFTFEQLKCLFPEEMRAYTRWNEMRDEYQKSAEEEAAEKEGGEQTPTEAEKDQPVATALEDPIQEGGHLQERAVQFDVRTSLMDPTGYMKFSEHRKGSLLPRRVRQQGDMEWEENRKVAKGKRGPTETGVWANMTAPSARFLHWVGFDPDKGLPPPNDETTQALAFLGYDFVGRIVEKVSTVICNCTLCCTVISKWKTYSIWLVTMNESGNLS